MKFSKLIVAIVILLNILFTAVVLYIFYIIGREPSYLIGAWFAFTTGELWMLSSIKKAKVKKDNISNTIQKDVLSKKVDDYDKRI